MLLALLKWFRSYAQIMQLVFKQNKGRTARIKTKQGVTPCGTAVFYIFKYPGLILY